MVDDKHWELVIRPSGTAASSTPPPTWDNLEPKNLVKVASGVRNGITLYEKRSHGVGREEHCTCSLDRDFVINKTEEWTGMVVEKWTVRHRDAIIATTKELAELKSVYHLVKLLISNGTDTHLIQVNSITCNSNTLRVWKWTG